MRVISGQFKGRKLLSPKHRGVRPTTDRVKESIFNILAGRLSGSQVLDLFAGTGSLSIEACSRGAGKVIAVEKHPMSLKVLFDNLKQLQISHEQIQVFKKDVFAFLKTGQDVFDLIFIDPPFTLKLADRTLQKLSESSVFHHQTITVIESDQHEVLKDQYGPLHIFDRRSFGDKRISFFSVPSNPSYKTLKDIEEEVITNKEDRIMESMYDSLVNTGIEKGRLEGRQEGRLEGRQEGLKSVILNMLRDKVNVQAIMQYTGASKEQVLELQKQTGL